jgi:hypothetical protein
MGRACSMIGEKRKACRLLVGKPEKEITGKTKTWVDNIKMDGVAWTGMVWLSVGTTGGLRSRKIHWSFWVSAQLAASSEGLSSMALVDIIASILTYVKGGPKCWPLHDYPQWSVVSVIASICMIHVTFSTANIWALQFLLNSSMLSCIFYYNKKWDCLHFFGFL